VAGLRRERVTLACPAGLGEGGLGRHAQEIVADLELRGVLAGYYVPGVSHDAPAGAVTVRPRGAALPQLPPIRLDARLRTLVGATVFDRAVAHALVPAERHVGFSGASLATFRRARRSGSALTLVSPTPHVQRLRARFAEAYRRYPFERPWLGGRLARRYRLEYDLADRIQVASAYAYGSFVEAGVAGERLERFSLSADERFRPMPRAGDGLFRIVYVGGLTVAKGVPVLLEAFARVRAREARLVLVGGWASRGMRRHVLEAMSSDPRIELAPGDPLPHLQRADLYVHPSFGDGFGYAPIEALACGVPVIVTEDTGMKEHVREGENGHVVPTGDVAALAELVEAAAA
jgi:glycosyltransferase involved in cell wall biosynthesis